jgi:hypothetical protein
MLKLIELNYTSVLENWEFCDLVIPVIPLPETALSCRIFMSLPFLHASYIDFSDE